MKQWRDDDSNFLILSPKPEVIPNEAPQLLLRNAARHATPHRLPSSYRVFNCYIHV